MTPILQIADLSVRHGSLPVLRNLALDVPAREATALLGENGAGKSTLMQAIIGLLPAEAGTIRFEGQDITRLPPQRRARRGIGYCPEGRRVFGGLTVTENLLVACWADAATRKGRVQAMQELFPVLRDARDTPAWQLSGGQQQMLAVARSLMNRPRLLLLDEPALGLSPRLAAEIIGRIPAILDGGCAVLLADQGSDRALRVCRHAFLLRDGGAMPAAAAPQPGGSA